MGRLTMKDGTRIAYKDWGAGQPVVFSHGWPLSADAWEAQMTFLAERGYRCVELDLSPFILSGGAAFCMTLRLDRTSVEAPGAAPHPEFEPIGA